MHNKEIVAIKTHTRIHTHTAIVVTAAQQQPVYSPLPFSLLDLPKQHCRQSRDGGVTHSRG